MTFPKDPHEGYYECHITLDPKHKDQVTPIAEARGFKVSCIAGDELYGDEIKMYCTAHAATEIDMRGKMAGLTAELMIAMIPFIRRKIERVIFDERRT